jgi:hypothetical protein
MLCAITFEEIKKNEIATLDNSKGHNLDGTDDDKEKGWSP